MRHPGLDAGMTDGKLLFRSGLRAHPNAATARGQAELKKVKNKN